eukprot:scaffold3568_cov380-Prasinococcus_capsulatus_cf.AAC.5
MASPGEWPGFVSVIHQERCSPLGRQEILAIAKPAQQVGQGGRGVAQQAIFSRLEHPLSLLLRDIQNVIGRQEGPNMRHRRLECLKERS